MTPQDLALEFEERTGLVTHDLGFGLFGVDSPTGIRLFEIAARAVVGGGWRWGRPILVVEANETPRRVEVA